MSSYPAGMPPNVIYVSHALPPEKLIVKRIYSHSSDLLREVYTVFSFGMGAKIANPSILIVSHFVRYYDRASATIYTG